MMRAVMLVAIAMCVGSTVLSSLADARVVLTGTVKSKGGQPLAGLVLIYQVEADTSGAPINPCDWYFVVADHQCNTTDILGFPHEPTPPRVVR